MIALGDKGAPSFGRPLERGVIAQLVERVLCKHEVVGSIPSDSTIKLSALSDRGIQVSVPAQLAAANLTS